MTLVFEQVIQEGVAKKIILDISLQIFPGITVVMGGNGSGKTTMLKTAAGLLPPARGTVCFKNVQLYPYPQDLNIGYIPQEKILSLSLKVKDALSYLGTLRGVSQKKITGILEEWGLTKLSSLSFNRLSPGESRRFFIAQSFLQNNDFLVFDEATSGLDSFYRQQLFQKINKIRSTGTTILISTHFTEDAVSLADTLIVLEDGRICYHGQP